MDNPDREVWRVLYVDDDEDDFLLTRAMLRQSQGRKIILDWASTYQAGQERLRANHYDAVLVDYDLSPHTGTDLIREATAEGYQAPFILYTGRGSYDVDLEAMKVGATLYLTKTEVNALLLERSIRYAIERKRIERERLDILSSIRDGFIAIGKDWRIIFINRWAAQISGYDPDELTGQNIWGAFPKLLDTRLEENYRHVMETRIPMKFEMRGVYQDLWYEISIYPFHEGISVYWQDITERKRTDEALRANEFRFRKLFDSMQEAFFVCEIIREEGGKPVDFRYLEVNSACLRIGGFKHAEEMVGHTYLELFPPNPTFDYWCLRFGRIADSGEAEHFEQYAQATDMYFDVFAYSPSPGQCAAFLTNITGRRRAEEALRESEEMLRLAFTAGQAGAWSWDLSTNVIHWSDEYYRIFGFEPGSIQPSVDAGFSRIHPDDLPGIEALVQKAIESGTQIDEVHRIIWSDGSVHWVRGISRAFYDEQGQPYRMAGLAMDITKEKQAGSDLEAANRRTAEILESISDAFYSLDQEGRFTYVNQKAASLWGKQTGELLGKNIWEVFPTGEETESYRKIQQALEEKRPIAYESYSAFLDQWVDIHIYPTEHGISVYFRDITERKREEETLANYARELERSNLDLQEFAFVASHDLQEPLRKIEALGDLILENATNLTERQRDQFDRLRKSAGRMREMVDGLLKLSRLSTQAQPFQPVDLRQVTQDVLIDLELQVQRSGGVIEVCELPVIQADPLQMRLLMQNLIGNALKFHLPGEKPLVKVYSYQSTLECVEILVKDNGIGFDEELAGSIFQPFKRLVGKSEFEGSGIGLAISRKIVERHGGKISVRSKRGQGSTFIVTLPTEPNN